MTDERIADLESFGFEWKVGRGKPPRIAAASSDRGWKKQFQQLVKFRAAYGHSRVPSTYINDANLGRWVNQQRKQFRLRQEGKYSRIADAQISQLDGIGFDWEILDTSINSASPSKRTNGCTNGIQNNHSHLDECILHRSMKGSSSNDAVFGSSTKDELELDGYWV